MPTARAAAARAAYWASWRRMASPKVYSATDQGRLRGSRLVDPERSAEARAMRQGTGFSIPTFGCAKDGAPGSVAVSALEFVPVSGWSPTFGCAKDGAPGSVAVSALGFVPVSGCSPTLGCAKDGAPESVAVSAESRSFDSAPSALRSG